MSSIKHGDDGDSDTKATQEKRQLPESIQRLRAYRGSDVPLPNQNLQQSLNKTQPLKGPYAKQPPVYVGNLSRKDLARKNRIQTALLGMGLGCFVAGIYGWTIWKRMQLGIDDKELNRLEQEALRMVESGEIDLEALQKESDQTKIHEY